MCSTSNQREALSEALFNVHQHEPESKLSALWRQMCSRRQDGHFVVNLQTATRATLHQGTTKLEVKRSSAGAREDCYAFVPFESVDGFELNVMEVHGIAVAQWHADVEQEDGQVEENAADAEAPHPIHPDPTGLTHRNPYCSSVKWAMAKNFPALKSAAVTSLQLCPLADIYSALNWRHTSFEATLC
jgi:hypothetical protein